MATAAVNSGPRYAPADPTLPAPWRALVDGNTGYIYYWNTETNVTQYEKPPPPQAPPQQVPPLPVGPPPGTADSVQVQAGSSQPQNGRPVEMRGAVNGSVLASTVVSPHSTGQNIHGMNSGPVHAGSVVNSSQPSIPNLHANPGVNVPGNMYGNMSNNLPGHPGGANMTGGAAVGGGHVTGSSPGGGHISGSATRSGPGMSGVTMHMNVAENSFGGSGRPAHNGSSGGTPRGVPGGNTHNGPTRNVHNGVGINALMQPKLAVLPVPQRQQVMGGLHMPVQSRQMGHVNSAGPGSSAPGYSAPYKRTAGDFANIEPDSQKRPRMQGFAEPTLVLDVDAYRRQHEISVVGDNVPAPYMTFDAANFPPEIARELHSAGFSTPTPIQAQSWPLALQSRDVVAIAKTGSGKTLGYLLPAFLHLARNRANSQLGPVVLVLAPTRELATQIQEEALKFGKSSRISCTCVYGGAPKGPQLRDLDRGADIVIATPGRLNDFLEVKKVSLRQVSYLVLDEADRMLDMGFEPQIRKIVKEIPPRRQTLMYTATWPKEVRKIAADLLVNAVQVNMGNTDQLAANKAITQHVEIVPPYEKQRRLEQILRSQEPGSKIIIFCSTKKMCDQLARSLGRGFGAAAIHGDKSQSERDYVLAQFKAGRSPILVATDVAARGLDIKDIRVVINFDFPTGVEDYVHRIGRTGRAGATGLAFTFFADQDSKYAKELIAVLEGANQKVPLELRDLAAKSFHPKGRGGRWEAGSMGGRDGGYNSFGSNGGGRGGDGRSDGGYGGRGSWGSYGGQFDRRERTIDRFGDKDRFADRSVGRDRFTDDRNRGRDSAKTHGTRGKGRSYSRSYSRSPSRSRGRSPSRSGSRSRSYDRYSDDRNRRSPYRGRGSYRSRSPRSRSPYDSRSPPRHGKVALASNDSHQGGQSAVADGKLSVSSKEHHSPNESIAPSIDLKVNTADHSDAPDLIVAAAPSRETAEELNQQEEGVLKQDSDMVGL